MSLRSFGAALLLLASALPASVSAQGGGFTAGDLYLSGQLSGVPLEGLVRVDPISGDTLVVKKYSGITFGQESLAFDTYRQRLIVPARLDPSDGPLWRPYLVDGAGNFAAVLPPNVMWGQFAPTGDGRIYFHDITTTTVPLQWIDAANQLHVLYEADGVTPFTGAFMNFLEDLIWFPAENALIAVNSHPITPCPGGIADALHIRKLPLSADGTRVIGPVSCGEFDVNGNDTETSHGLSFMSDGDLLLGAHNGIYGPPMKRLVRVDPATLAASAFASFGDASNGGTTWSSVLGKAVTQTHFTSGLLAYSAGQVDNGAFVPCGVALPSTRYAIEEIPSLGCDGGWIAYGTGLAGKGGFVPRLQGVGCVQPGASFQLKLDQVVGGATGTLFVGLAPAALPFKGGTLLVAPILLQAAVGVGGGPGVAGVGSLTLPATLANDPGLTGLSLFLQAAFSDGDAIKNVSLTQGLELEIG